jgi:hypothetical protein
VTVSPAGSGPVATQGTAGYGDAGISATASSTSKQGAATSGGYYSSGGYTYAPVPGNTLLSPVMPVQYSSGGAIVKPSLTPTQPCPPGQTGYFVYGPTGIPLGVVCVPTPSPGNPSPGNPVMPLAQQASSLVPWPNLVVRANPDTGLAGLASWFWVAGGTPNVPTASATSGPITVTVRATLIDVMWDFGDGTPVLDSGSSVGKPYPQASDVTHVYQTDSYGVPGGYTMSMTVNFAVVYSVNGGPWTQLGTVVRAYSRSYAVYQAQPEGVVAP